MILLLLWLYYLLFYPITNIVIILSLYYPIVIIRPIIMLFPNYSQNMCVSVLLLSQSSGEKDWLM